MKSLLPKWAARASLVLVGLLIVLDLVYMGVVLKRHAKEIIALEMPSFGFDRMADVLDRWNRGVLFQGKLQPGLVKALDLGDASGSFLISLAGVVPHDKGWTVSLRIAPLLNAIYRGSELSITWGQDFVPALPGPGTIRTAPDQWEASLHHDRVRLDGKLMPATWNEVTFTLAGTDVKELTHLFVSLRPGEIIPAAPR